MLSLSNRMSKHRQLVFIGFLVAIIGLSPVAHASADTTRYFIKNTKSFWKNTLGVHNEFDNGFTADLSDLQLSVAKLFGVDIEPVKIYQILPSDEATADQPTPTATPKLKTSAKAKPTSSRPVPSDQTPWGIEVMYNNAAIASTSGGSGAPTGGTAPWKRTRQA